MAAQMGASAAAARAHEELYAYWARLRQGGKLPGRGDIRPDDFKRLLPTISLIDVDGEPLDFRLRLAGTGLYGVYGREITGRRLGDVYNVPAITYLVRRDDGNIWIHFAQDTAQGGIIVGQEKGFVATASLLPASEMKKQLDAAGKVALQVNFATDKTDVLADSLPQIEQVAALLKQDPSLQLAVNGHTDDSGDAAHNQQLSEGRAKSVVALLTAKGIDAARLTAAGFGSTQPVADNGTQEGKARNRRVELVKQ